MKAKHPRLTFVYKTFITGVIQGFGAVIGGSLGIAIFIYALRQVEFIPYLGEIVAKIVVVVQHNLK